MGETWQLSSISASLLASMAERVCLEVMKSVLTTFGLCLHSISFGHPRESLFLSAEFGVNSEHVGHTFGHLWNCLFPQTHWQLFSSCSHIITQVRCCKVRNWWKDREQTNDNNNIAFLITGLLWFYCMDWQFKTRGKVKNAHNPHPSPPQTHTHTQPQFPCAKKY